MLNMSDIIRGYTDTIIPAQLLDHDSYGYEINKNVQTATNGLLALKEATLYTTFRRLEGGGYILLYWGGMSKPVLGGAIIASQKQAAPYTRKIWATGNRQNPSSIIF